MVSQILLNDTSIRVESYDESVNEGLKHICVDFKVTSDDYHTMTTLLYEGTFCVKVPEKRLAFTGTIQEYSTSITNLYEKDKVGDFKLCLKEV